jgi:hypothetical protein
MKPKGKTVCLRNIDPVLYAAVKAQAKAEGIWVKGLVERALHHELARLRKETPLGEE